MSQQKTNCENQGLQAYSLEATRLGFLGAHQILKRQGQQCSSWQLLFAALVCICTESSSCHGLADMLGAATSGELHGSYQV